MVGPRSPFALAALACAAVQGVEPVTTQAQPQSDREVDAALVEDTQGRRWIIRAPRSAAAGVKLDAEARLLEALSGWLPFSVPTVSGTAPLPEGGHAVLQRAILGDPLDPAKLAPGPGLAADLGGVLAAVHDLPTRLVEDAGLPVYEADEYRQRRLAEVDRAAATGHVPARLLGRWERALEEAGSWRFVPSVVHGDLAADTVLVRGESVSGLLDWTQTRVGDPADDFAWLAGGASPQALESVLEAYAHRRRSTPDRDLARRAGLAAELALVRWLLHGTTSDDDEVVGDAVAMLAELDATVDSSTW